VAVPTTYIAASLRELDRAGFRLVIYANQALRAALGAMRDALVALRAGDTVALEKRIAVCGLNGFGKLPLILLMRGAPSPSITSTPVAKAPAWIG
jgi:hypothetical protein